ncbi:hypothetical protein NLN78_23140, partial [Citrobacter portucalensis]|nr:hypothetical protein [Citrobacter portucalensis]
RDELMLKEGDEDLSEGEFNVAFTPDAVVRVTDVLLASHEKTAELVYTGRFDLNPARNTREKLLLPLSDIKPLQQAGVYI